MRTCVQEGVEMSIIQRNEGQNAFVDDQVNYKTNLKQLMQQYDNAPRNNIQKKYLVYFNSLNTLIRHMSACNIKWQYLKVYTM